MPVLAPRRAAASLALVFVLALVCQLVLALTWEKEAVLSRIMTGVTADFNGSDEHEVPILEFNLDELTDMLDIVSMSPDTQDTGDFDTDLEQEVTVLNETGGSLMPRELMERKLMAISYHVIQHTPTQLGVHIGRPMVGLRVVHTTQGGRTHISLNSPYPNRCDWHSWSSPAQTAITTYTSRPGPFTGDDDLTWDSLVVNQYYYRARRRRVYGWHYYRCAWIKFTRRIRVNDRDECQLKIDDCEQNCENTVGSYRCYCDDGYFLHHDGRSCVSCSCPPGAERLTCSPPLQPCVACSTGTFKPSNGSQSCSSCDPCGPGQERIGCGGDYAGECEDCPAGKFKVDVGQWNSMCVACPPCGSGYVRVGCGFDFVGKCVRLQLTTPSCSVANCADWWAAQTTEVKLETSGPLCGTGANCSEIIVSAELRYTSSTGEVSYIDDIGTLVVDNTTVDFTWRYTPALTVTSGYSFFVAVSVHGHSDQPHISGSTRSDDFPVHSVDRHFEQDLLLAAKLSRADSQGALEIVHAICHFNLTTLEDAVSASNSTSLRASLMNALILQQVACTRVENLHNGGDFYGIPPNNFPALRIQRFDAIDQATEDKLALMNGIGEEERHNQLLNLFEHLRQKIETQQDVSMDEIKRMLRNSSLVNWNETQADIRKRLTAEIAAKENEKKNAEEELFFIIGESRMVTEHVVEGLQEIGFYSGRYIETAEKKLAKLRDDLKREVAAYTARLKKAQKRNKLLKTIKGGLMVAVGAALVFFQIPAGWVLIAQGVAVVAAAQAAKDIQLPDLVGKWISDKDTEGVTEFIDGTLGWHRTSKTVGSWLDKIDFAEKDLALTRQISGYIDQAESVLQSLFGVDMPAGAEEIQRLQMEIAEMQKTIQLLRGVMASLGSAGTTLTVLQHQSLNLFYGISPPLRYAAEVKASMLMAPVQHFLDVLRHDSNLPREKKITLEVQEKRISTAVVSRLELDKAMWEAVMRLSTIAQEWYWLKQDLAALDARHEEIRQELQHDGLWHVSTPAQVHFLARTGHSTSPLLASLVMDIHELLRKLVVALTYFCLNQDWAATINWQGAQDYIELQEVRAALKWQLVRCLEERAKQTAHTRQHSYDLSKWENPHAFQQFEAKGSLSVCIPPPSFAADSSIYWDSRVVEVSVYLLGITGPPRLVSVLVERRGPVIIVTRAGEVKSFIADPRQWFFQYDTATCSAQSSSRGECGEDHLSRVSPYGCWLLSVAGFEELPWDDIIAVRVVFDIQAHVRMNLSSSESTPTMFPDMPHWQPGPPGQACNIGMQEVCASEDGAEEPMCRPRTSSSPSFTTQLPNIATRPDVDEAFSVAVQSGTFESDVLPLLTIQSSGSPSAEESSGPLVLDSAASSLDEPSLGPGNLELVAPSFDIAMPSAALPGLPSSFSILSSVSPAAAQDSVSLGPLLLNTVPSSYSIASTVTLAAAPDLVSLGPPLMFSGASSSNSSTLMDGSAPPASSGGPLLSRKSTVDEVLPSAAETLEEVDEEEPHPEQQASGSTAPSTAQTPSSTTSSTSSSTSSSSSSSTSQSHFQDQ